MSARPAIALLPPEELDLLISRSIDGDLPAEEQEELERYLATDPEARRRRDAMAELVRSVRELPAPEPPFALSTRVNAQVLEKGQGISATWNRLGLYPPAGVVPGLVALVVAGALGYTLFGRGPRAAAPVPAPDREAPVRVFFQDSASALKWNVEVVGAAAGWRLTTTPATRPTAAVEATYRLTLDPAGHVASLTPLSPGANVRPDVAQLLRGLVFERTNPADTTREVDVRISAR